MKQHPKPGLAITVTMYDCALIQQYRVTEVHKTWSHTTDSSKHTKHSQLGIDGPCIEGNPSLLGKFSTSCLTVVTSRSNITTSGSSRESLYSTGKWHFTLTKSLWKRTPSTSFCKCSDMIVFFYLLLYEPSLSKSGLFVVSQHRKQWESFMLPCT